MKNGRFPLGNFGKCMLILSWVVTLGIMQFLYADISDLFSLFRNSPLFLLFVVCLLSPCLIVTWSFIVEGSTNYSTKGINRLTIMGNRFIAWSDIDALQHGMFVMVIEAHRKKYVIRLLMYQNSRLVIDYVQKQILLSKHIGNFADRV